MHESDPKKNNVVSLRESAAGAAAQTGSEGDRARRFLRGSSEKIPQTPPVTGEMTAKQLEHLKEVIREFRDLYSRVMDAISVASKGELGAETIRDIQLLREKALYVFNHRSVTTADLQAPMEELNTQLQNKFGITFHLKTAE